MARPIDPVVDPEEPELAPALRHPSLPQAARRYCRAGVPTDRRHSCPRSLQSRPVRGISWEFSCDGRACGLTVRDYRRAHSRDEHFLERGDRGEHLWLELWLRLRLWLWLRVEHWRSRWAANQAARGLPSASERLRQLLSPHCALRLRGRREVDAVRRVGELSHTFTCTQIGGIMVFHLTIKVNWGVSVKKMAFRLHIAVPGRSTKFVSDGSGALMPAVGDGSRTSLMKSPVSARPGSRSMSSSAQPASPPTTTSVGACCCRACHSASPMSCEASEGVREPPEP